MPLFLWFILLAAVGNPTRPQSPTPECPTNTMFIYHIEHRGPNNILILSNVIITESISHSYALQKQTHKLIFIYIVYLISTSYISASESPYLCHMPICYLILLIIFLLKSRYTTDLPSFSLFYTLYIN